MRIVLIAAQSLDGFITRHTEPGTAFTSPEDKTYFVDALAGIDVAVFGGVTYRVSRESIRAGLPRPPRRIVLTRSPGDYAAEAVPGALEFTAEAPARLAARLRTGGCRRCAILGGSQIHTAFFAAGLVDEVWLTVEPVLFGAGTPLLAAATDVRLALRTVGRLGASTLLLKYDVVR